MLPRKNGSKRRLNVWKISFLVLLSAQVAFFAVIASRLIEVREPVTETVATTPAKEIVSIGTITTTKEQLNETLSSYMNGLKSKNITFNFYASSTTMLFEGTYTFLGYEVPLYIYFEPYASEEGAVQLKLTSFSAGTLSLPKAEVLKYLSKVYDLPKFVHVDIENTLITINLEEITNKQNIFLKAKKIDLKNDVITFDIYKKIVK
ncbi:YpmS family protein [Streptococcus plurextorum]|uniref:YpmS family protein n=1 Tax=Streptococcus plurextorum TaxID=456876 RepID=UPI000480DA13|nr:YpmS family protein [Streptococcus plurextorum]